MPYAVNNGVSIHYHVTGNGPPLVIQHGITGDLTGWDDYAAELKSDFTLIRVDARGHGRSDKPGESSSYGLEIMAGDVAAVLDHLELERAAYLGYSMGGMIGYAMGAHHSDRLTALIIGGAPPTPVTEAQRVTNEALRDALLIGAKSGPRAYLDYSIREIGPLSEDFQERAMSKTREHYRAFAAVIDALMRRTTDYTESFRALTIPRLVYIGARDEFFADFAAVCEEIFREARVVVFPEMTHDTDPYFAEIVSLIRKWLFANLL